MPIKIENKSFVTVLRIPTVNIKAQAHSSCIEMTIEVHY